MPDTTNTKSDLEILTQLNADFVASAQKAMCDASNKY
jgi:hypothetical protein